MHPFLLEWLVCPDCHGVLRWRVEERSAEWIERASARCQVCGAVYPTREGIGVFLTPDLDREDLWEQAEGGVVGAVRADPELAGRLMDPPLESLSPADQLFRAMVHEARDEFELAHQAAELAYQGLYTADYRSCRGRQVAFLQTMLHGVEQPVVDLASGRGGLVEPLLEAIRSPLVLSDFSLRVLRRNRRWLAWRKLEARVSLLAFDARRMPFRDAGVPLMTTNLGLPNMGESGRVFADLGRVIEGSFYALTHFYPSEDDNAPAIRSAGLASMLDAHKAVEGLEEVGFSVSLQNRESGRARPTPRSRIFEGVGVDALPIVETDLIWCVLVAEKTIGP